ncbi:MAG: glycosyltransferase family 4 protein [Clostridiales bacterium]|nr:glycosyltransferase family 4 protein [Clostridiales bacterium]MCC8107013.1 glycosyltransferase family 4 protein [Clostridiales bacterium]
MNIYQIVPNLGYGDGVGNEILAIDRLLKEKKYHTAVYAIVTDQRIPSDVAYPFDTMPEVKNDDIVILHLAVGSDINEWFKTANCRKIVRYHNITPARYFEDYSHDSFHACESGLEEIKGLNATPEYCLADSDFNKRDLIQYGYQMPIDVVPILIRFSDYETEPDESILNQYKDDKTNILFTGRVVPNKKQEDVILAFYYYQKYYNRNSRLFLVGSYDGMELYYNRLADYINALGVQNVIFTGHIKFNQILAYYHLADIFLCMSEHEGFCIPLAEAMYFQIPIIAADNAAVGETLGEGGILLDSNDCLMAAGCIDRILKDEKLRTEILQGQRKELQRFEPEKVGEQLIEHIIRFYESDSVAEVEE